MESHDTSPSREFSHEDTGAVVGILEDFTWWSFGGENRCYDSRGISVLRCGQSCDDGFYYCRGRRTAAKDQICGLTEHKGHQTT